jgi:hypothetical protein
VRHWRASNRIRARERTALCAWAAQRAALDSWQQAELKLEELRARTHAGLDAEGAPLEAARLDKAEQQAAELRRQADACRIAYRETLERMQPHARSAQPVETVVALERMA